VVVEHILLLPYFTRDLFDKAIITRKRPAYFSGL